MNHTKKIQLTVLFGLAVLVLSAAMFGLLPNKNAIFTITYLFTLLSFSGIYVSGVFLTAQPLKAFPHSISYLTVAIYYTIAEIILGVVGLLLDSISYLPSFWPPLYLILHLSFAVIAVAYVIFAKMGTSHIATVTSKTHENIFQFRMLQAEVQQMMDLCCDAPPILRDNIKKELESVYDDLRYSDPISSEASKPYDTIVKDQIFSTRQALEQIISGQAEMEVFSKSVILLRRQIKDRNNRVKMMK